MAAKCSAPREGHKTDSARQDCGKCGPAYTREQIQLGLLRAPGMPTTTQTVVETNPKSGTTAKRVLNTAGKLHSEHDQPSEEIFRRDGSLKQENWHTEGKLHREGEDPASIDYEQNGMETSRRWFVKGAAGRASDGLRRESRRGGKVTGRVWQGGSPGTTREMSYMAGGATTEQFFKGKQMHRLDGPALIRCAADGSPFRSVNAPAGAAWYIEGEQVAEHCVAGHNLGIDIDNTAAMDYLGESDWQHMTLDDDQLAVIMTLFPNS